MVRDGKIYEDDNARAGLSQSFSHAIQGTRRIEQRIAQKSGRGRLHQRLHVFDRTVTDHVTKRRLGVAIDLATR